MARNRTRAQRNAAKNRKLALGGLAPNQIASLDGEGRIQIRSTDLRGKDNFGVVSNLGRVLFRGMIQKEPHLPAIDRDYLQRNCLPLYSDRENGVLLY
jgi:hypothetical protein